jgi:hypothetical protein
LPDSPFGPPCKKDCSAKKKDCVKAAGTDEAAKKKRKEDAKACKDACKK